MIIKANGIRFNYRRGVPVFDGLSFEFGSASHEGRVVGVVGSSGTGKSTLLRLLAGLETPAVGKVTFDPPLTRQPVYIFQEAVLLEQYSRVENARYRSVIRASRQLFEDRLFSRLQRELGLDDSFLTRHRPMDAMSGGQRQRLALLRDLSVSPELVLMDEPCVGLDPIVKVQFLQTLRSLVSEYRILLLYVTHHADELALIADDVLFLGRPMAAGSRTVVDVGSLQVLRRLPPTVEAAAILSSQPVNILMGWRENETTFHVGSREGRDVEQSALVFATDIASPTIGDGGIAVKVTGASATYLCLDIVGSASTILALRSMIRHPTHVIIKGPGFLYDCNGRNPLPVSVSTLSSMDALPCLTIAPYTS